MEIQPSNVIDIEDSTGWEEYKGGKFWHHAAAGAMAGVSEHLLMFPFDTIKTNLQALQEPSACSKMSNINNIHNPKFPNLTTGGSVSSTSTASVQSATSAAIRSNTNMSKLKLSQNSNTISNTINLSKSRAGNTMRNTYQSIVKQDGIKGLYRGVSAMAIGCVPAHVAFFASYEITKDKVNKVVDSIYAPEIDVLSKDLKVSGNNNINNDIEYDTKTTINNSSSTINSGNTATGNSNTNLSQERHSATWLAGTLAGAVGVFCHDAILTPLDVAKQRMQLGAHSNCSACVKNIIAKEGYWALYRSFPITLMSNVPFGAILVGVNETLKEKLNINTTCHSWEEMRTKLPMYFSIAGFSAGIAGFATQPLDVIKTRLQTQNCLMKMSVANLKGPGGIGINNSGANGTSNTVYKDVYHAAQKIYRTEGARAFFKGTVPRSLVVIPSGAVSWATYEAVKSLLAGI